MKVVSNQPLNVLFLCTGNSARSIMAECILNRLGGGKFKAFSAGSQPAGKVNPFALQVLRLAHYDMSGLRSKPWDEFATPNAPKLDFVFTVCDNAAQEVCPIWPGQPMTAHWGLPDPARAEGSDAERRSFSLTHCGCLPTDQYLREFTPRQTQQAVTANQAQRNRQDANRGTRDLRGATSQAVARRSSTRPATVLGFSDQVTNHTGRHCSYDQ